MHASTHDVLMGFHIVAVMAWMAGQLYLPRLYVYHSKAAVGSEMDQTFQVMEQKLLRIIMNPAMILAWILGLGLIWYDGRYVFGWGFLGTPWMITKLAGVIFMSGWHGFLSSARRKFAAGQRPYSEKFWRMTNELPFLVLIVMVLAITTKFTFGG